MPGLQSHSTIQVSTSRFPLFPALRRRSLDMFHWWVSLPGTDWKAASAIEESVLDIATSHPATLDARKWLNWHRRQAFAISRGALVRGAPPALQPWLAGCS